MKEKCGSLEKQEEDEFLDFIRERLFSQTTQTDKERAATFSAIVVELLTFHTRGGFRRKMVEAYKSAVTKRK